MWGFLQNKIKLTIMKKVLTIVILPILIIGLAYLLVASIMKPVDFQKEQKQREAVGIERLKDIRTLQEAFKSVYGRFSPTIDSLKDFYNNGKIKVVMQIGSMDDSVAVANTEALKKRNPRITPEQMMELYRQGQSLVIRIDNEIPVTAGLISTSTRWHSFHSAETP